MTVSPSFLVFLVAVAAAPIFEISGQAGRGAPNTMKVTIGSGPDRGTHTLAVGPKNHDGTNTCAVLPRADRQPGSYFNGHFYPDLNNKPGLMEAVTAFNAGPNGSTNEASLVVTFVSGAGATMALRAYEAESRPSRPAQGRASASFARTGTGATARVEGETSEGVKVTMEVTCNAVANR